MKFRKWLNYKEEYIPPTYDEETGEVIEPAHLLKWYRYRNYFKNKVSCTYKFIDEVLP